MSKIEWTNETWNTITGCEKISTGCKNCYAKTMHKRLTAMGQEKYKEPFSRVVCHYNELEKPYSWKKPRKVFVNSMSDIYNENVPLYFIQKMFKVMNDTKIHSYQLLTKRSNRLLDLDEHNQLNWSDNIWQGVSVENSNYEFRIRNLIKTNAKIKFLSCEPLLSELDLRPYIEKLDWVIVGGESGPKSRIRKMQLDWARDIQNQCDKYDVKFFFKQSGTLNPCKNETHKCKGKGCNYLDGELYQNFPFIDLEVIL